MARVVPPLSGGHGEVSAPAVFPGDGSATRSLFARAVLSSLAHSKQIAANPELLTADAVLDAMQRVQAERTNMEKSR